MNPKSNLPEEQRQEIFSRFDGCLTAEEEKEIRAMFPQYLFFRNEYRDDGWTVSSDPVRICTCTACGESFEAVRGNYARGKLHHEKCNCPQCGAVVEGIAVGKYKYDMQSLERWVKTVVARPAGDGGLLLEAGNARRRFNRDNLQGELDWFPNRRYYLNADRIQMWEQRIESWNSDIFIPEKCSYQWMPRARVIEPFQPNMRYDRYDGSYHVIGLEACLEESNFKYCRIREFYRDWIHADLDLEIRFMILYLAWYAMIPQIEMAYRINMLHPIFELITQGKKNAKLLNWNAGNPADFLRMSCQDAKLFIRNEMDFQDLKDWREAGKGLRLSKYIEYGVRMESSVALKKVLACCEVAGCTPEQGVRYIERLRKIEKRYDQATLWEDYLHMAERLHYDLSEKGVAMPKNLQERHDAAVETVRQEENLENMKKYAGRRKKLEKRFAFNLGDLCVLVPNSAEEIVQEGKTLHHCVGGYAGRHIQGGTTILFIRKRKKPGRSFLTVEVSESRPKVYIRQVHGYRNENYRNSVAPQEKYRWFLQTWLDWVNAGSRRDENGQPVLPAAEERKEKAV